MEISSPEEDNTLRLAKKDTFQEGTTREAELDNQELEDNRYQPQEHHHTQEQQGNQEQELGDIHLEQVHLHSPDKQELAHSLVLGQGQVLEDIHHSLLELQQDNLQYHKQEEELRSQEVEHYSQEQPLIIINCLRGPCI